TGSRTSPHPPSSAGTRIASSTGRSRAGASSTPAAWGCHTRTSPARIGRCSTVARSSSGAPSTTPRRCERPPTTRGPGGTVPERELVPVGRVGKPHGLDGGFFVEGAREREEVFVLGATLYARGQPATVVASRHGSG